MPCGIWVNYDSSPVKKTPSEVSRTHLPAQYDVNFLGSISLCVFYQALPMAFHVAHLFFSATGWFYGFDKPTLRSMTVFEVGNNTGST